MTIKVEAETLRCGLLAGCATVDEAVAWADGIIAQEVMPDIAVIDVSLASRRTPVEVAALLEAVAGEADGITVRRRLMSRMLHALNQDPGRGDEIARWLYSLAARGELPEAEFGTEAYALEDTFDLARQGIHGTVEGAVAELRTYLERRSAAPAP